MTIWSETYIPERLAHARTRNAQNNNNQIKKKYFILIYKYFNELKEQRTEN